MARMIPAKIYSDTKSPGEHEIFRRLQNDPATKDWVVLHSLDIPEHIKRISGEADFLIVVPEKGVLCLEVKAASTVRRENGVWHYGSNPTSDPRGPFKQASEAMHSIRQRLVSKDKSLSEILYWSAVIFPYLEFTVTSSEWHNWQVIDNREFQRQSISQPILKVFSQARQFVQSRKPAWFSDSNKAPSIGQCKHIADMLRPDFEFFELPKVRVEQLRGEVKKYTDEQFVALDAMESNPRVVFTGPAGTGKTMLAIEAARRSRAAGRKTLLICFNRQLAKKLEEETSVLQPELTVGSLHSWLLKVSGKDLIDSTDQNSFWQNELPLWAINNLLEDNRGPFSFDEIIVDEMQDILRENYLDFLDLSLKGGLNAGRWRFFGDFEKQAIYDASTDITFVEALKSRLGNPPTFSLRVNCRNTPRIATLVHLLGDLNPHYNKILRPDNRIEPQILYYRDQEQQKEQLVMALNELQSEGYAHSDIVILSTRAHSSAIAATIEGDWKNRLRSFGNSTNKHVQFGTIHSFKGLESPAVIITDVDKTTGSQMSSLFYVAMTRALHRLVILTSNSVRGELLKILLKD